MTIIRAKLQTTDFLFLSRSSLLLSEICQNIDMKFDAQIAANGVSGSISFKKFSGGMPPDLPSRSHAFGARLHDHSHDAGFATAINNIMVSRPTWKKHARRSKSHESRG